MSEILRRIQRNPVLIAAFVAAALEATDGKPVKAAIIAVCGVIVRQFTVPASEA
jgi:hypothetical protein